jgi:cytochrome P450
VQGKPSVGEARFVTSGMANFYIPFGVGERICPGQFLAKRLIMAFCAEIVFHYDIEILSMEKKVKMDPNYFGLGTERPARKIPFRIRKRSIAK